MSDQFYGWVGLKREQFYDIIGVSQVDLTFIFFFSSTNTVFKILYG